MRLQHTAMVAVAAMTATLLFFFLIRLLLALPPPLIPAFEQPVLVVHLENGRSSWDTLLRQLPEETRMVLEGIVQKEIGHLLGKEVSMEFDLLPILNGPTTLQLSQPSGTGELLFVLQSANPERTSDRLTELERLFAESIPEVIVIRRNLEEFESVRLESDPEAVERRRFSSNQWDVSVTRHAATGRTLILARRDRQYLITNDEQALGNVLRRNLQRGELLENFGRRRGPIKGMVDAAWAGRFLPGILQPQALTATSLFSLP